jgi:hypothetical protein
MIEQLPNISAEVQIAMDAVTKAFVMVEGVMAAYCANSRETSLAFTNMEQSLMWAIKSLAVHGRETKVE